METICVHVETGFHLFVCHSSVLYSIEAWQQVADRFDLVARSNNYLNSLVAKLPIEWKHVNENQLNGNLVSNWIETVFHWVTAQLNKQMFHLNGNHLCSFGDRISFYCFSFKCLYSIEAWQQVAGRFNLVARSNNHLNQLVAKLPIE